MEIVEHYEKCLEKYGDTHRGVDWPNAEDARTRYKVMLDVIREADAILLDFGCGCARLLDFIVERGGLIEYLGYDLSAKMLTVARAKYPDTAFYNDWNDVPEVDYIVANGVFTEKLTLSWDEMAEHFTSTVAMAFQKARIGMAFNVMSTHLDWQRDDLFHVPMDWMADFVISHLGTRNFVMRNDYGLWEYTTYVYR